MLLVFEQLSGTPGDDPRHKQYQKDSNKGNRSEQGTQRDHAGKYAENGERIRQKQGKRVADGLADCINVVGQPAHQLPMLVAVKESHRQTFHRVKEGGTDLIDDSLTGRGHKELLEKSDKPFSYVQGSQQGQDSKHRGFPVYRRHHPSNDKRGHDGPRRGQCREHKDDSQLLAMVPGHGPEAMERSLHILRLHHRRLAHTRRIGPLGHDDHISHDTLLQSGTSRFPDRWRSPASGAHGYQSHVPLHCPIPESCPPSWQSRFAG